MNEDYYAKAAKDFSSSRQGMRWEELALVQKYIGSSSRVLDIGCGNGRLLNHVTLRVNQYVGVDFSEELLREARRLHADYVFENHNMISLPYRASSFDVICMIASLHHLRRGHKQVLQRVFEILRPDGVLFMTNWNLYREKVFDKVRVESRGEHVDWYIPHSSGVERYYYGFKLEELDMLLKGVGFEVIKNEIVGQNLVSVGKK